MENNKKYSPSRKQIAEYWKDKYISKDFKIIDSMKKERNR